MQRAAFVRNENKNTLTKEVWNWPIYSMLTHKEYLVSLKASD